MARTLPLVSELTTPPVVGRYYMVNCVNHLQTATKKTFWVPALGGIHTDPEVGGIGACPHVHFDFRFVSAELLYEVFDISPYEWSQQCKKGHEWRVMAQIRAGGDIDGSRKQPPFEFRLLKRRCIREQMTMPANTMTPGGTVWWNPLSFRLETVCKGKRLDPANPVCPHRGINLADVPVDADGCVTCPGHGLKWNRTTGELVTRYADLPADRHLTLSQTYSNTARCLSEGGSHA